MSGIYESVTQIFAKPTYSRAFKTAIAVQNTNHMSCLLHRSTKHQWHYDNLGLSQHLTSQPRIVCMLVFHGYSEGNLVAVALRQTYGDMEATMTVSSSIEQEPYHYALNLYVLDYKHKLSHGKKSQLHVVDMLTTGER